MYLVGKLSIICYTMDVLKIVKILGRKNKVNLIFEKAPHCEGAIFNLWVIKQ